MEQDKLNHQSWELCNKAIENLRTKGQLPLPIHYQTEFNHLLEEQACAELSCEAYRQEMMDNDINKYLEIAKTALEAFLESHQEISVVMDKHTMRKASAHPYEETYLSENCSKIVSNLALLDTEMAHALLKANERIHTLNQKLEHITHESRFDNLTGFYNRKELFKDLISIVESREHREGEAGCYLLMIDLDDFKEINDNHSHLAGDKTLIFVAKTIASIIRNTDKAYRFGGDEFILVLNRCTLDIARKIAEKIRLNIEKAHLFYESKEIKVTVSIGVTKLCQEGFESSILKADQALYEAKRKAKNHVYVIEEEC